MSELPNPDPAWSTTRLLVPVPGSADNDVSFLPSPNPARKGLGGLRTRGYAKRPWLVEEVARTMPQLAGHLRQVFGPLGRIPVITVVTIIFNDAAALENTLLSVIGQTYPNIEYIVIDGGSTDGSLDIVHKYENLIDLWVSEPDRGIYDAMNKGCGLANGEWVNFMNSGDRFHDEKVVENIFFNLPDSPDVIFGDSVIQYTDRQPPFERLWRAGNPAEVWKGMFCSHQSIFARTSLLLKHPLDSRRRIVSDIKFLYTAYKEKRVFHNSGIIVAVTRTGGVSERERLRCIREWWSVVKEMGATPGMDRYFTLAVVRTVLADLVRRVLPRKVASWLTRMKYAFSGAGSSRPPGGPGTTRL